MKKKITLLSLLMALFLLPIHGLAYTVNNEFNLGPSEGSAIRTNPNYIVVHDTANALATGRNEATFMKRNWMNAYTAYIVGDGIAYKVGEPGYVQYGAGSYANANSPVQIELQATPDHQLFLQNYAVYIALIRDTATQFGIPLSYNHFIGGKGIISHAQVSALWWGDHTDPVGYLASHGISEAQFAHDIEFGVNNPTKPTDQKHNGIAVDNVNVTQATKMVQRIQTKYAWTLLRDQVKSSKQKDGRYTLTIKSGKGNRLNQSVARLKQELRTYYPGYMQQNIAIVDGEKDTAKIEARNMPASFEAHMRNFLKDILLDGQTYAEANSYGTYDVRIKGEGFKDHDAPIVLKEIQEMGKAKDVGINPAHIKGFKY
ncbi:N-acetylmuramoyl-L-alanine amidase [Enterococcus gilvus]|uniref:N-acetylmuramoyl-L-alanine amidase n=1 Tax=Enterococcus gilvus TaxID=160453 RepID=UPI00345F0188